MKAIILAGGFGTRLKPITNTLPKPMVKVAGKPILEHILILLRKAGVREFIFALCYLPDLVTDYFGDGSKFGVKIDYSFENPQKPLGTAGALKLSEKKLSRDFIVTSGDTLRELNIKKIIKFHKQRNPLITLNAYQRFGPDPKSIIKFNNKQELLEFTERPKAKQIKTDFVWTNGFFYICQTKLLKFIPRQKYSDFAYDIFPKLIETKQKIYVYPSTDYLLDIGDQKKLAQARKLIFSETRKIN